MRDLDRTDRRVLYELDRNSRIPFASLAKKLKIPPETIRHRVNRLFSEQVISNAFALIDSGKLGFAHYKVLIRLHNVTEANIREIFQYLHANKHVLRLAQVEGAFDIAIAYKTASITELDTFINDLTSEYGSVISKRNLSANVWSKYLPRSYLIGRARRGGSEYGYAVGSARYQLDKTNHEILKLLAKDSRIPAAKIADSLKHGKKVEPITATAVLQRIARLEKDRIIKGYSISLDPAVIGRGDYKVLLFFNQLSEEDVSTFLSYCQKNPNIVHVVKSLGGWDYELDMEVEDFQQYRSIVLEVTSRFAHLIKDYSALRRIKLHKYNFYH